MSDVEEFYLEVGTAEQGSSRSRLDRWLAEQLTTLSRSRLQKLIETGQVTVNDHVCTTKKLSLTIGDRIQVAIPAATELTVEAEPIPLDVLYEDDALLIINKPVGMVVHPAPGHWQGTLVNALLAHCQDLAGIGGVLRPGIVHRLDRDTSGAIVVAKTDAAMLHLQAQIQAKTAQRDYVAVIHGTPQTETGTIDQPIGRHPGDRKRMAVVPEAKGGRRAVTHWHIQERLGNYTVMDFRLETGRTHQIRVHSAFLGHPIVGDPDYGPKRSVGVNLPGQALHAWQLTLQHPSSGEIISAIAPWPEHLHTLVRVLRSRC
ncbi:MAG: RluA family pseudouridine synthase [Cyanobacteria bacterium P01_H01_bin.121]